MAVIGMYIQLQQLVVVVNSADKELTEIKVELSQTKKDHVSREDAIKVELSQIKKDYMSRDEFNSTIQFILTNKGN